MAGKIGVVGTSLNHSSKVVNREEYRRLEEIYATYNRKEFIHPDPLEFVLRFTEPADQEVAGMVAAALAFGRVGHILKNLERVSGILGSPAADVAGLSRRTLRDLFGEFRHRWIKGEDVADLLNGVRRVREEWGSLEECFAAYIGGNDETVIPALASFVQVLRKASGGGSSRLLSYPSGGSACKRLMLFLRWMIRKDDVDPGPWVRISPSLLVVPLDTHMHRISRDMGWTGRRQADLKSALEVTAYFRMLSPGDPVRYDFALTRPGIRGASDGMGPQSAVR